MPNRTTDEHRPLSITGANPAGTHTTITTTIAALRTTLNTSGHTIVPQTVNAFSKALRDAAANTPDPPDATTPNPHTAWTAGYLAALDYCRAVHDGACAHRDWSHAA